ncbi:cyclic lactone autoinducer peptide [Paenibacillus sonchi]|uniref:Cyclic lactone autoinducer peptide n=1 Tax=Paenibacillus sonchi TaxID=373687 RepID=A0A974SCY8_9BACL|nr:cyclic lactone autoinducer peptide [Paenibacillus sonchi]QQZ60834.1 cyclic lactone autoinducer peptide [Paenibacillus sonchi]
MKKSLAKYTSSALAASARFFVSIMKPAFHSPEAPKELRK